MTSGKGGVGKSTVTANLAVALARRGLSVGVLDADVHGFSIPGLLGIPPDTSPVDLDGLIVPPVAHGVKAISIGMFLPPGDRDGAVAWRGPMLHRTLNQFLTDVHFGDLDVLLLDTPPGTGDVAISLGQLLPTRGGARRHDAAARRVRRRRALRPGRPQARAAPHRRRRDDVAGAAAGRLACSTCSAPAAASRSRPGWACRSWRTSRCRRRSGRRATRAEPHVGGDDDAAAALEALAAAVAGIGRGLSGKRLPIGT